VALALGVFRISLVEELSRLLCLYLLFRFCSFARIQAQAGSQTAFFGAPSGLAAGLGFAAAEGIFYSVSNPGAALWRIFARRIFATALHAACGARIGTALSLLIDSDRKQAPAAAVMILTAILIHAMYNFCILNPRVPSFLAALLALVFLASSLLTMCVVSAK
jgi:RsiW-degrading membrane proteinase PrsW (M82 family)